VLEYDATSEMGKKMLPEPPVEVPNLLKPSTVRVLEGIIGYKFKRPFYLAQVLVSKFTSVVEPSAFNAVNY
jgi:hypothetical protein